MYLGNESSGAAVEISNGLMSRSARQGRIVLKSYRGQCDILNGILAAVRGPVKQFFVSLCVCSAHGVPCGQGLGASAGRCNADR